MAAERTAGLTMRGAALDDPRTVQIVIRLASSTGRLARLRIGESHAEIAWLVANLDVRVATKRE